MKDRIKSWETQMRMKITNIMKPDFYLENLTDAQVRKRKLDALISLMRLEIKKATKQGEI